MQKIAFKMKLRPGMKVVYKRRHDEIWPELVELLKASGVTDYTIFLDEETDILFGVQRVEGNSSQELGTNEVVQRWWKYMADIMETNDDFSPITVPLETVFHLD